VTACLSKGRDAEQSGQRA
jgi:hypothetical protein